MKTLALRLTTLLLGAALMPAQTPAQAPAQPADANAAFLAASDAYFDQLYLPYNPTGATLTGYHQYDAQLDSYSRASIDATSWSIM